MALESQKLLEKYRAEEKAAAEKGTPAEPESTKAEQIETETKTTPTGEVSEVQDPTGQATETGNGEGAKSAEPGEKQEKDRWEHTQQSFEKRLRRQERSHRKTVEGLERQIAEMKKQLEDKAPKLQREDFPSIEAYEEYKNGELRKQIAADQEKQRKEEELRAAQKAESQKKVEKFFPDPESRKDFNDTITDFVEDNDEWLGSDEGQLFQEIIDESPIGVVMAMAIAKNEAVVQQMKHWSKDMLYQKMAQFESTLLQKAQGAKPEKKETPKPSTEGIPSTGSIGKSQTPATFNAKDWLRKNRPERYAK